MMSPQDDFELQNNSRTSSASSDLSKIKNRWHAKKTREKKKIYMEVMKDRLQFLEMEGQALTKNFVENKTANILLHLGSRSSSRSNSDNGNHSPLVNSPLHYDDTLPPKPTSTLPKLESQLFQETGDKRDRGGSRKRDISAVSDESGNHPFHSYSPSTQDMSLIRTTTTTTTTSSSSSDAPNAPNGSVKRQGLSRRLISLSKLPSLSELNDIVPKHSKISDLLGTDGSIRHDGSDNPDGSTSIALIDQLRNNVRNEALTWRSTKVSEEAAMTVNSKNGHPSSSLTSSSSGRKRAKKEGKGKGRGGGGGDRERHAHSNPNSVDSGGDGYCNDDDEIDHPFSLDDHDDNHANHGNNNTRIDRNNIAQFKRERNRIHAKLTRDRKKLFAMRMEEMISFLEERNQKTRELLSRMGVEPCRAFELLNRAIEEEQGLDGGILDAVSKAMRDENDNDGGEVSNDSNDGTDDSSIGTGNSSTKRSDGKGAYRGSGYTSHHSTATMKSGYSSLTVSNGTSSGTTSGSDAEASD